MPDEPPRCRLDPKKPRHLTPEEERLPDETAIDYSDIPPLGDEFFSQPMTDDQTPRLRREHYLYALLLEMVLDECTGRGAGGTR